MEFRQHVVVLGAGFTGVLMARQLHASLPPDVAITLIDKRNFYYHLPATVRAFVSSSLSQLWAETTCIPLTHLFGVPAPKRAQVIQGTITAVEPHKVTYTSTDNLSHTLSCDCIIIATGSQWPTSILVQDNRNEAIKTIKSRAASLQKAKHVLVLGAGSVGLEIACDIKHEFPNTQVTIVHRRELPLTNVYPPKFRLAMLKKLQKIGIQTLLSDEIVLSSPDASLLAECAPGNPKSIKTHRQQKLLTDIDYFINATGSTCRNTGYLPSQVIVPKTNTLHDNLVKTKKTFQVDSPGWESVYCVGDCANVQGEVKMAFKYYQHAQIVVSNVLQMLKSLETNGSVPAVQAEEKKSSFLKSYEGQKESIFISLGPKRGLSYIPMWGGIVLGDFITSNIKSKNLFITAQANTLGFKKTSDYNTIDS